MTEPFLAAAYKNDMKANGGEKDAYAYFPVAIGQNQDLHITVAFLPNPTETQLNALDVLFETMALVARTERPIATVTRQAFFYDGTDREPEDEETVVPDGAVPVLVVKMAPLYTFLINQYAKDHLVNKFGNEYPILHITCPIDPVTRSTRTLEFMTPIGTSIPLTRVALKRKGIKTDMFSVSLY